MDMLSDNETDVSRKASETSLSQSDLEQVLRINPCGVVVTDATVDDNPIIYANPAFEQLTGYQAAEVIGHNPRFLQGHQPQERIAVMRSTLRQAIAQEQTCLTLLENFRKDGSPYWVEVAIAPITDETGKVIRHVGIQSDVTDLVESKQQLQNLYDKTIVGCVKTLTDSLAMTCPIGQVLTHRLYQLLKVTLNHWPLKQSWELRCAVFLAYIGCPAINDQIMKKYASSEELTDEEFAEFRQHPAHAAKLLHHIPQFGNISQAILHQHDDYTIPQCSDDGPQVNGEQPPLALARILRILVDFDGLRRGEVPIAQALTLMEQADHSYDPQLLAAFRKMQPLLNNLSDEQLWVEKTIQVADALPGMIVIGDVMCNSRDVVLLAQGQKLTPVLIARLHRRCMQGDIPKKIHVKVKTLSRP